MISPERLESLQGSFLRLLQTWGRSPRDIYPQFDRLVQLYSEPHRHYHTLEHIAEMLKIVGRLSSQCENPLAVQLAVWWHDAVYDPTKNDNESLSADLAGEMLPALGVDAMTVNNVQRLILATAHFTAERNGDADTDVLLDADLAILGAAEARYDRYAAAIRQEYANVPQADYRIGRAKVLQHFLAMPRIYRTAVMFAEGEKPARVNLERELRGLS
jgi:predicted metal-dependent HD superfamily phosphohydrolase